MDRVNGRIPPETLSVGKEASDALEKSKEYGRLYRNSTVLEDLQNSIENGERALRLHKETGQEGSEYLSNLAIRYHAKFEKLGEVADLETALSLTRDLVSATKQDNEDKILWLCFLSDLLLAHYEALRDVADLDSALAEAEAAFSLSSKEDPYRKVCLITIQDRLWEKWRNEKQPDDDLLDRAIEAQRELLKLSDADDPQRFLHLNAHAKCLKARFDHKSQMQDLDQATACIRESYTLIPSGHAEKHMLMNFLSSLLMSKYQETGAGELDTLLEAEGWITRALELSPEGDPKRGQLLVNYGNSQKHLHSATSDVQNLRNAIKAYEEVMERTSKDHPERYTRLQAYADCLQHLYQTTGDISKLDEAIQKLRESAEAMIHDEGPDAARTFNSVSSALQLRYEILSSSSDLEEAVNFAQRAVDNSSRVPTISRCIYLNSLGNALSARYDRFKNETDLENAIKWARLTVATANEKSPDLGLFIGNLSTKLWKLCKIQKSVAVLEESLELTRKAISLLPAGYELRTFNVLNLSGRLAHMYENYKPEVYPHLIDESIELARECLNSVAKDSIERCTYAVQLGRSLYTKAGDTSDLNKWHEAISILVEAFDSKSGRLTDRIEAGRLSGLLLMFDLVDESKGETVDGPQEPAVKSDWVEAERIYSEVLRLIQKLSTQTLDRQDMLFRYRSLSNVSTFAAVAALKNGRTPAEALQQLEYGRGITSGLLIDMRQDVSELSRTDSHLYNEYERLKDALQQPTQHQANQPNFDAVRYRAQLEEELKSVIQRIRQLPSFDRFQLAPSSEELCALAEKGPLVSFNVTRWRSDAFIVQKSGVSVLPLPLASEATIKSYLSQVIGDGRLTQATVTLRTIRRSEANTSLQGVLEWLWKAVVRSVLDYVGFLTNEATDTPHNRIWWVCAGYLGLLPLHAAGDQWNVAGSTENAFSHVVSSYTPTIKALAYARQRNERSLTAMESSPAAGDRLLVISMPKTPRSDLAALHMEPEIRGIIRAAGQTRCRANVREHPTCSEVLHEMKDHSMVHFACHGDLDVRDPSASALILGNKDNGVGNLSVKQVFEEDLPYAQLAYLSACSTAQQNQLGLIDEGVHLGNAFQLAGFPSVIATQWEADDEVAGVIAANFYQKLFLNDGSASLAERSAVALHEAVIAARNQRRRRGTAFKDILAWAPFIHIGI